jgi:hypothetical protein
MICFFLSDLFVQFFFTRIMQNPQMMAMAQNMMQDPAAMAQAQAAMSGTF